MCIRDRLYCVLTDRKNKDPNAEVDVIARAEDASKISRIVERFNLASVDTASIVTEAEKSKDAKDGQPEPDIGGQEKAEKDKLLDELMGKPVQKEENAPNPSVAKTEKSPQSEPTLELSLIHILGGTRRYQSDTACVLRPVHPEK